MDKITLILWKKADLIERTYEDIVYETFESLKILRKYPDWLQPNYLTCNNKDDANRMFLDYDILYTELQKGCNRIEKKIFSNLGYSLSFFSSKNEADSCKISLRVGVTEKRFFNTFIIDLPDNITRNIENNQNILIELFSELIASFNPYWGCISNSGFLHGNTSYMNDGIPAYLHWINYWSKDIICKIGTSAFNQILNIKGIEHANGILRLNESMFNSDNKEDLLKFNWINQMYLNICG